MKKTKQQLQAEIKKLQTQLDSLPADTIQFPELWLEIMAEDLCNDVTMKVAQEKLKELWDGRRLPTDQELEAMVYNMDGEYLQDKIKNFYKKVGMDWWYWTSTKWNSSRFVIREFSGDVRSRGRNANDDDNHVRPVRPL